MEIKVELAPLDSTDVGLLRSWRNNYQIWRWSRQNDLISDAEQVRWFNRQSEDPSVKMYKIVADTEKAKGPVGSCGLSSIDVYNRRAEFSIYIAPQSQRLGLGKAALSCLLHHAFKNLGLNVVWGECFDGNPAIKMFESLGFSKDGTLRQFYFKDGKFIDAHLISITAGDFDARRPTSPNFVPVHSDFNDPDPETARPKRKRVASA